MTETPESHPDSLVVSSGRDDSRALSPALWTATAWESESMDDARRRATGVRSDAFYARYANPTVGQFERIVAELEGAESALAFASGMGALASVVLALCGTGSHVVAQNNIYGATRSFLEGPCRRFGIETTFVDPTVPGSFAGAVRPGRTMLVLAETPSNPRLALADLAEIGAITGPFTVVDSTMATPLGQRPLDFGVDLVVHSATKGIGGHNDALIGVIAGSHDLIDEIWAYSVMHGAAASPHDALNAMRGVKTLGVRTQRQHATALAITDALDGHPGVATVLHPFHASHPQHELARRQMRMGGSLLSFELTGGIDACRRFFTRTSLVRTATSFGGPETLACHPATSTHVGLSPEVQAEVGVTAGLVRMSVGLEDPDELIAEIVGALS